MRERREKDGEEERERGEIIDDERWREMCVRERKVARMRERKDVWTYAEKDRKKERNKKKGKNPKKRKQRNKVLKMCKKTIDMPAPSTTKLCTKEQKLFHCFVKKNSNIRMFY